MFADPLGAYVLDWLSFLARWLHVIAGIAWIGASFYFVWLDNHLREPAPELKAKGVAGELWAVHGGGFYNPQKYLVAPATLPRELHWFKWEAYTTWLSGVALLVLVYYAQAGAMMRGPAGWPVAATLGAGVGSLVAGWAVYDALCRSRLGTRPLAFGLAFGAFMLAAAWALTQVLGGRAGFIHVGAMLGTIMAANVFMVIIPGQRRMVAAMQAGAAPDPSDGARGKQRSVHNNYLTLPVLFVMVSHHAPMFTGHPQSWLVLGAIAAAGVLIRHFFNLRHRGVVDWRWPLAGAAVLLAVAIALAPRAPDAARGTSASAGTPEFARVQAIVAARCAGCHAQQPAQAGFAAPPAGLRLDDPVQIVAHALKIHQQAVLTDLMPPGNLTGMSAEERAALGAWFAAGAPGPR